MPYLHATPAGEQLRTHTVVTRSSLHVHGCNSDGLDKKNHCCRTGIFEVLYTYPADMFGMYILGL